MQHTAQAAGELKPQARSVVYTLIRVGSAENDNQHATSSKNSTHRPDSTSRWVEDAIFRHLRSAGISRLRIPGPMFRQS